MKQAMILAAGLGTRLRPLTDTTPKALVTVGGKTLLERVVERLRLAGFGHIVINTHHLAGQIASFLVANDNFGLDIRVSNEQGVLLETGGGVKHARPLFETDSPVLIHNVDILSNADLGRLYDEADRADAVLLVSQRTTKRYLLFDDDQRLTGWTNVETGEVKPRTPRVPVEKLTRLAFAGIHVLSPQLLPLMDEWPDRFSIIDFYLNVCDSHRITGYVPDDLRLLDIGKLDTLEQAESFIKQLREGTN